MKAAARTCACAISLDHLDFRLFMFGSFSRSQDEYRRKFIVLKKLFEFGAYANALDCLDCSRGALAVFNFNIFISGSKCLSPLMNAAVRTCPCAILFYHLDIRLFMFGSHC